MWSKYCIIPCQILYCLLSIVVADEEKLQTCYSKFKLNGIFTEAWQECPASTFCVRITDGKTVVSNFSNLFDATKYVDSSAQVKMSGWASVCSVSVSQQIDDCNYLCTGTCVQLSVPKTYKRIVN